jgi:hypothetical protein
MLLKEGWQRSIAKFFARCFSRKERLWRARTSFQNVFEILPISILYSYNGGVAQSRQIGVSIVVVSTESKSSAE